MPLIDVLTGRSSDPANQIEEILDLLGRHYDNVDEGKVRGALDLALEIHADQKRKDGQPYIVHPLAVARTCAEYWMSDVSVASALLHDTLEDADKEVGLTQDVIAERFGADVGRIVMGVTKLDKIEKDLSEGAGDLRVETLKKLLRVTAREDLRIIIIKIFDRYHNAQTLTVFRDDKRRRIGEETMRFYVPIAERLGFYKAARGMEDDVFRALQPQVYKKLRGWVDREQKRKGPAVRRIFEDLRGELEDKGIEVVEKFYPKGLFYIYQMSRSPEGDVNVQRLREMPVFNITMVVPDEDACFRTLNVVHSRMKFLPEGVRDFINNPKINGYQSIHTVVRGPGLSRITVVIRTPSMDWRNHLGVIADLRDGRIQEGGFLDDLVNSFDVISPSELLDLTGRLFFPEIDVVSPAGQTFKLPEGSTALDFAYHIHTDLGHRAETAFIGGRERKLNTRLRSGQMVEIVKAKEPRVRPVWHTWVKSDKARLAIRKHLGKVEREEVEAEPERFAAYVRHKVGIAFRPDGRKIAALRRDLGLADQRELALKLYTGLLSYDWALAAMTGSFGRRDLRKLGRALVRDGLLEESRLREVDREGEDEDVAELLESCIREDIARENVTCQYVDVSGAMHPLAVRFALCCRPGYGDSIVAITSRQRGVTIHRQSCGNVGVREQLKSVQLVPARWQRSPETRRLLVQVEGSDRRNLLHDLTKVLADFRANIVELSIRSVEGDRFQGMILLQVSDLTEPDMLVDRFNAVHSLQVTDSWQLP